MMKFVAYKQHLVDLAQKCRTGQITEAKYLELDNWFRSLENIPLGSPIELTVNRVEKRLH